jgi:predicted Na+-dependent transporter
MISKILIILLSISSLLTLGLKFKKNELNYISKSFQSVWIGLLLNYVLVPLFAIIIIKIFSITESVSIALMICAMSPGGASSALYLVRANSDHHGGAILLSILNFTSPILTSILVSVYIKQELVIDFNLVTKLFLTCLFLQTIPLFVGILISMNQENFAIRLKTITSKISNLCLVAIILFLIFKHYTEIFSFNWEVWLSIICIFFISVFLVQIFYKLEFKTKSSLSLVTSTRSLSLALLITETHIKSKETYLVILLYGFVMFSFSEFSVRYWKKSTHS